MREREGGREKGREGDRGRDVARQKKENLSGEVDD